MKISLNKISYPENKIEIYKEAKKDAFFGNKNEIQNTPSYYHPSFLGNKEISRVDVLDTIEKNEPISNAGLKGVVYKLEKGGKSYAIKIGKDKNADFSNEAKILKSITGKLENCQEYVDYFKHPKTGADILVSTFVEGDCGVLETRDEFKNFFKIIASLDDKGILHGDLNMKNLIFDGDKIKLIDFGEGSFFKTGDTYSELYPSFVAKSNLVGFEHNGLQDCIQMWEEPRETFINYLKEKSNYYKEHSKSIEAFNAKTFDYENNYSKVLKSPSDEVIKNEARRIDLLYTFEQADTAVNYDKNPNGGIFTWGLTIKKADDALSEINKALENKNLSDDERKYFNYQKEIMESFKNAFSDWGNSTIGWIKSSLKNPNSEHEIEFVKNMDRPFKKPVDIYSKIISN